MTKMICGRDDCDNVIEEKKKFNQKYCSYQCCKIQTNRRIMEKYYDKKDRMSGKPRYCKKCKTNKLSRYNYNDVCYMCQQSNSHDKDKMLAALFDGIDVV